MALRAFILHLLRTHFLAREYQFVRIQTNPLINTEKILNRHITKTYNSDDVNVIATELQFTKTRPTSFYKKDNLLLKAIPKNVNKVLKPKC